jgi:hypothetical protein
MTSLVAGFDCARERLQEALTSGGGDTDAAFRAIFEALHWVVAIGLYARGSLPIDPDEWLALKYARNRADHQWGMALRLADDVPFRGGPMTRWFGDRSRRRAMAFRIEPTVIKDWVWVDDAQLPPPSDPKWLDPKGQAAYIDLLEGKPAREALERFSAVLTPFRV